MRAEERTRTMVSKSQRVKESDRLEVVDVDDFGE